MIFLNINLCTRLELLFFVVKQRTDNEWHLRTKKSYRRPKPKRLGERIEARLPVEVRRKLDKLLEDTGKREAETKEEAQIRTRLSKNLIRLRNKHGFSQEELAHRAEISWRHFQHLEKRRVNVTINALGKLCKALKADIADLLRKAS